MKTMGRLRAKYGGNIEDLELPNTIQYNDDNLGNWHFISKLKGIPRDIIQRYSMLYIPEDIKKEVRE
ncbi:MAG: hypothetical protein KKF54_06785 [Candidatus Omnitrophica bacterium]|nr:hypothetical protein [Candidatus Omnitrophota bacterium]